MSVSAPFVDGSRAADERERFPPELLIQSRVELPDAIARNVFGAAPVLFVLVSASTASQTSQMDFRRLERELHSKHMAAHAAVAPARELIIAPARDAIVDATVGSAMRHLLPAHALVACRVRTDA